jgi:predicted ester cyclase
MSEESKQLVQRFAALATSDPDGLGEVVADSYVQHSPTVGPGLDGVRNAFKGLLAAFPDLHIDIDQVVAEADLVMARMRFHGTHKGPFLGAQPTGNQVDFETADSWRVQGGKLAEHWDVVDRLTLLQQIGLIPT